MFQAVEVEGQAKEQRLTDLHGQSATGCFGGEFAFDDREHRFYFGAWSVQLARKFAVHQITDFSIGQATSACRNHTEGSRGAYTTRPSFREFPGWKAPS